MTNTFTADELFIIRTALRSKVAETRRQVAAGEALGLNLVRMEQLFGKVTDLYEEADNAERKVVAG